MMLWLALCVQAAPEAVRAEFKLLDLPPAWVTVLVVLPLVALVAWIGYARAPLARARRITLAALRAAALLLLAAVLARPVWVERREDVRQAEVLVLVDDSASMRREDGVSGEGANRARLAKYAGSATTRTAVARGVLTQELQPLLAQGDYALREFRFAEGLEPLANRDALDGRGRATHLGDAVQQALSTHRGRHVTDIVVLSDGRSNGGAAVSEVARAAKQLNIPVHTVVMGDARVEENLVLQLVEAPSSVLEGDEVGIVVRVRLAGAREPREVRVVLEELDKEGARVVYEEKAMASDSGVRTTLIAPSTEGDSQRRERRFRASVAPLPKETLRDDNAVAIGVRVAPEKLRVLYIDAYPRWEYRYLKNLLLRSDANLVVQCWLMSATSDFPQESTRGVPPLKTVPTSRRELMEGYDVVILGDVNPYEISADPARCEEFLSSLREFVERGGGLILQAGENDAPRAYAGTALEELLPVVVDPTGATQFDGDGSVEFRPRLEDPLAPHPIARLLPDAEQNRALWEDEGGLRGFYWYSPVVRAKPGSEVVLRHPTAANRDGRLPLVIAGHFPAGRTLFLAVDSTWGWRFRFGDRFHERFWRNAIRWVALGRLKSGDRRVQLDALESSFDLDERAVVEARVLDADFRPSEAAKTSARMQRPDGSVVDLDLPKVDGRPGVFRASFEPEQPGLHSVWMEEEGRRTASTEFEVRIPSRENQDPTPDPAALQMLSRDSGGRHVAAAQAADLASEFPGGEERREALSAELEDAWDSVWTLVLALLFLGAEWILRKRSDLV